MGPNKYVWDQHHIQRKPDKGYVGVGWDQKKEDIDFKNNA